MIQVAVDAPLRDTLTYLPPEGELPKRGDIVEVPLGKRQALGFVIGDTIAGAISKDIVIKPISAIRRDWPSLQDPYLKFLEWISNYYMYPLGRVLQLTLPPLEKKDTLRKSKRSPVVPLFGLDETNVPLRTLTEEQSKCFESIKSNSNFTVHLVHGVTGSGKTEIYLRLFRDCLERGKRGLFLLPEISLTPQLVNRFAERFGNQIAVLHSQLTERERTTQWWEITVGNKSILIGARSALFCPINDLGLIVVDEEHETSFKQDEKLKYNGRDCAIMLGKAMDCPVILGSATPSLETWNNVQTGKFKLHELKHRVYKQPFPETTIIDMRLEKENDKRAAKLPSWLSQNLYEKMISTLERGDQVALLLNRRGLSNVVFCQSCGYSAECPNCDISLTLHARQHLVCHYCDYHQNFELRCPDCKEGELVPLGVGTEKLEADLVSLFPDKRIARADRDEITNREDLEDLVSRMEKREIDILIGTQMIAKGLDFPHLNLVGLVLADVGFNLPDFRATEKSFQLITQMSGRSGRNFQKTGQSGEVVIQTYNPDHDALLFVKQNSFEAFANFELKNRFGLTYPPYNKIIVFRISSTDLKLAQNLSLKIGQRAEGLKAKFPQIYEHVQILGPATAPLQKIKNNYRFHLLLKSSNSTVLNRFASTIIGDSKWIPAKSKVVIDVDPMNLL